MFQNYLKIAWRNLRRQPGFTVLNMLGLAIGMAGFLFLLLYVQDELSYDQFHSQKDRIFRMELNRQYPERSRQYAIIPPGYADAIQSEFPGVSATCRLFSFGPANMILRQGEDVWRENNVAWSDSTFFEFFDIPLLVGNAQTALAAPQSVVLTASLATKYFGPNWQQQNVIGQSIEQVQANQVFTISGVCADVPHNSHLAFDLLISSQSLGFLQGEPDYLSFSAFTFLMFDQPAMAQQVESQLSDLVVKYASGPVLNHFGVDYATYQQQGNGYQYSLRPLPDIYLDAKLEGEIKPPGSRSRIYFFSLIAVLILLIAGINFINLSTARSAGRAREVGIRKTLGSEQPQLIAQFLTEALLISGIAAMLAAFVVTVAMPWFNQLTDKVLSPNILFQPFYLGVIALVAMVTGLASGVYPSFFLAAFKPKEVLQGKLLQNTKGAALRNVLVVCQFAISIFLIIATILIYQQLQYTDSKALGFDKSQLLMIQNTGGLSAAQSQTFLQELEQLPGVEMTSACSSVPGQFYFGISFQPPGAAEMTTGSGLIVGEGYVSCMDMELVAGREFSHDFADSLSIIINEAAAREMGLADPVGQRVTSSDGWLNPNPGAPDQYTIVGVIQDYHFQSLHHSISPLFLVHMDRGFNPGVTPQVSARLGAQDPQATLSAMETLWLTLQPDVPFSYQFMDQEWAKLYAQEATARRVFILFTMLAIAIACLGLLGLAAYMVEKRRKEISIRKVLGATTQGIVGLLSKDFVRLVLIALIVAAPLAYYFMGQWLDNFAYRITIRWWVFALAGGISIAIALLTVGLQSIRAALANPIKALRSD